MYLESDTPQGSPESLYPTRISLAELRRSGSKQPHLKFLFSILEDAMLTYVDLSCRKLLSHEKVQLRAVSHWLHSPHTGQLSLCYILDHLNDAFHSSIDPARIYRVLDDEITRRKNRLQGTWSPRRIVQRAGQQPHDTTDSGSPALVHSAVVSPGTR